MIQDGNFSIFVGETGHRNIVEEDKTQIKELITESLKEIQDLSERYGGNRPVVMLNAFAQGADMLCAEAAFEVGIDVYAVLPCEEDRYIDSFDDEVDKNKLGGYLAKAKRKFIAPDIEKSKQWIKENAGIDDDSYEYRQLGIYMAQNSHVLIALWDGKPPKSKYGCGTVEVIDFALEGNYLNSNETKSLGESAVIWIKSRRQGDGSDADIQKKWITLNPQRSAENTSKYLTSDEPPQHLIDTVKDNRKV